VPPLGKISQLVYIIDIPETIFKCDLPPIPGPCIVYFTAGAAGKMISAAMGCSLPTKRAELRTGVAVSIDVEKTKERLKDLDLQVRTRALQELVASWCAGEINCPPEREVANLHCHTFFSYNGYGHSPTSLAWLAREMGWHALATMDFDVLDGVDETLDACDRVAIRGAAGMETRVYLPEFAAREITSPGEPGVTYQIGAGFTQSYIPPPVDQVFNQMRQQAAQRNRDIVERVNAYLDPVMIRYERDVLPLTPAGNATERHILVAYDVAAREYLPHRQALLEFWANKLEVEIAQVDAAIGDVPAPSELIRTKLMKRGGVGYVQPGPDTFPLAADVNQAIISCGAIPVVAWVDGASEGEKDIEELLALHLNLGAGAVTIIPERNWRFRDPEVRELKVRNLHAVVELVRALDLPIIAGTEMNKAGQPLLDDLDAEPLRPLRQDFIAGADFLYGHTLMQRALGMGYQSGWAQEHLPSRKERNAFYVAVGRLVPPGRLPRARLARVGVSKGPDEMLASLERFRR